MNEQKSLWGDYLIAYLTLFSGLSISVVAIYYSVLGMMSIFVGASLSIMFMGVFLESSKLVITVWVKRYWNHTPAIIRWCMVIAVAILMAITSMGIYGFLSRAHIEQSATSGNVTANLEVIDSKIKAQKENVEVSRKALSQMDAAVEQLMARTTDSKGATNAAYLRISQKKERAALQETIDAAQSELTKLSSQREPIAAQVRKSEAEVGPIKYIAAMIYGDKVDSKTLEKSVRTVIIMIVIVFDPLAVVLLLASQYTFQLIGRKKDEVANTPAKKSIDDEIKEETKAQHHTIAINDTFGVTDSVKPQILARAPDSTTFNELPEPSILDSPINDDDIPTLKIIENRPPRSLHGNKGIRQRTNKGN